METKSTNEVGKKINAEMYSDLDPRWIIVVPNNPDQMLPSTVAASV